jgi:hypothetical protein
VCAAKATVIGLTIAWALVSAGWVLTGILNIVNGVNAWRF